MSVSTKPYLVRAIYEWCVDNGFTPYVVVQVDDKTQVPMDYVRNGEIVLNIGTGATRNLYVHNEYISLSARFNGSPRDIWVPMTRVSAVYARENGQGLFFDVEETPAEAADDQNPPPDDGGSSPTSSGSKRPQLRVIK